MDYRADLYAAGEPSRRTDRMTAATPDEAYEKVRQMVVALGLDYAIVFIYDEHGLTEHIERVRAER